MSYSNGTFTINSQGQPVVTGTVISSTVFNALTADLATGLSTCVLKDGTQTITANIPMSSFKFTGLAAGTASGNSIRYEQVNGVVTTAGDTLYGTGAGVFGRLPIGTARQQMATNAGATAPEWVASMQSLLTTTGDTIQTTAANTPARLPATASVAAHATTSDVWTARETILTGTAVIFTDIADAPYVGAVAWVYQNAAHTWTDGAVFDVQGGGNYTAEIGDWVRINAVTVSTFDVTIFKANGTAVVVTQPTIQVFTATGTWTKPTGCKKVKVTTTGGGGSGGANATPLEGAGGAGSTAIEYIDVTAVSSVSVTIGAGGAAVSGTNSGNVGGTSSFGAYHSAVGGGGGAAAGGKGGTATGGDINLLGGDGETQKASGASNRTVGGASYWGGGSDDSTPAVYGSGGAGAASGGTSCAGAGGICVVEEFY